MRFAIATGGSVLAASALLCACTSILGDFKSGQATTSASDGGRSDSGGDAAPAFKAQVCTEITTSRRELGVITSAANTAVQAWLFTHADSPSPSGVADVVVAYQETANSQASTLTAWKVKISGSVTQPQGPKTVKYTGQVLDVQPVATGFFSLAYESGNGSLSAFPSDPAVGFSTLFAYGPTQANRVGGALHVEHDGSKATELATVFSYQDADRKPYVGGAVWTPAASSSAPKINPWPVPPALGAAPLTKLDAIAQGMVRAGAGQYTAIVNPGYGTSDVPAPGGSPAIYTFDSTKVSGPTVMPPLAAPGVLFGGPLAPASATGIVNVGMLGGDLSGGVGIFAGQTALAGLGTLSAGAALKLTPIATVNDLPINGGRQHWDSFSGNSSSDNFIATGASNTGYPVFYWVGKDGVAIATYASTKSLFNDKFVSAFDVGFRSPPLGIGSTLSAVLVTQNPNEVTRVIYVEASCIPQ